VKRCGIGVHSRRGAAWDASNWQVYFRHAFGIMTKGVSWGIEGPDRRRWATSRRKGTKR
jgi:hypothetical protein